ncbi:glycosyltransferase family 4 protein [Olivibacter sitiensis]|uniref:glycosyltransferase family 4 protein n=1 Tax=Olivibacter sitiensis TaxID=376470 RepID=UPI00047F0D85|nr:glycosyltransferase family 1 protein [Olivibacter sitiensis]
MVKRLILIANYPADRQESMIRFCTMLQQGLTKNELKVQVIKPLVFFGRMASTTLKGYGKWLGYIDKWLLFPLILKCKSLFGSHDIHYHICDHSNAPYLSALPRDRSSITCHDVLAIRGALGYADAYCPASRTGLILQKWILKHLTKAKKIATVSQFTLDQLIALNGGRTKSGWKVILNGFNAPFHQLSEKERVGRLKDSQLQALLHKPYLLHLGSSLPRKNRTMLVKMLACLESRWEGIICFSGQAIDERLQEAIDNSGLGSRVVEIVKPKHELLEALINGAEVFVFPSYSEGFGWPVIEAQACGTPVIASSLAPMPEVGGDGALYADPNKPEDFAEAFLELKDEGKKRTLLAKGFENIKRFKTEEMVSKYINLFNE